MSTSAVMPLPPPRTNAHILRHSPHPSPPSGYLRPPLMPRLGTRVTPSCVTALTGMGEGTSSRKLPWSPAAWLSCLPSQHGVVDFSVGQWQSWFCQFTGLDDYA